MKNEKYSKRKIQADETKNKIYETARELFVRLGYDNVSVDSIVEAAGMSKGTFYVYFKSKDMLAAEIFNEYSKKADTDYKSFLDSISAKAPASDTLILIVGKTTDFIISRGYENMKVLYRSHISKTIDTTTVTSYNRDLYKMFADILENGVRQGEFRTDISVDTLAHHLVMAIRGLTYEWCIRYPDFDLKKQCLEHFELLLNGIKK